jgi:polyferredoxin
MFNILERRIFFDFRSGHKIFIFSLSLWLWSGICHLVYGNILEVIFCGWICPQTIFLEMVFRRIEFWIEGDRGAQIIV